MCEESEFQDSLGRHVQQWLACPIDHGPHSQVTAVSLHIPKQCEQAGSGGFLGVFGFKLTSVVAGQPSS